MNRRKFFAALALLPVVMVMPPRPAYASTREEFDKACKDAWDRAGGRIK